MPLYRELPVAAQTAYAELFEMTQAAEASRSPAGLSGKIAWKSTNNSLIPTEKLLAELAQIK